MICVDTNIVYKETDSLPTIQKYIEEAVLHNVYGSPYKGYKGHIYFKSWMEGSTAAGSRSFSDVAMVIAVYDNLALIGWGVLIKREAQYKYCSSLWRYVEPQFRHNGIGTELYNRLFQVHQKMY